MFKVKFRLELLHSEKNNTRVIAIHEKEYPLTNVYGWELAQEIAANTWKRLTVKKAVKDLSK